MAINTITENGVIRELASRYLQGNGGKCELFWNSETEEISLRVSDGPDEFEVRDIPKDAALDAWNHPYAYADFVLTSGRNSRKAA